MPTYIPNFALLPGTDLFGNSFLLPNQGLLTKVYKGQALPGSGMYFGTEFEWVAHDGFVNHPYYVAGSFTAGGNFTISIVSGALPPGIALSQIVPYGWLLSGTPTAAGVYSATAQLVNSEGASALNEWVITIYPDPAAISEDTVGWVGGG